MASRRRRHEETSGDSDEVYCSCEPKPKMIVFDLDYTLWQFWADTVCPPFRLLVSDPVPVMESRCGPLTAFPDSVAIMKKLKNEGYLIGIASRSPTPDVAWQAIDTFGWRELFDYTQIYPGQKTKHFQQLRSKSGVEYKDMIFFDDEQRNIRDVGALGVLSIFAPDGVSHKLVREAFTMYQRRK